VMSPLATTLGSERYKRGWWLRSAVAATIALGLQLVALAYEPRWLYEPAITTAMPALALVWFFFDSEPARVQDYAIYGAEPLPLPASRQAGVS